MNIVDNADEPLDPRIQMELENLNNATDEINKLEIELDEAHTIFRKLLFESTNKLKELANKIGGNCIERARCYYKALEVAQEARIKCQQQAQLFQRANEIHAAAKETVTLAEARFMSHQHEWNFDQAWQDMLNHATIKVMDAENQKAACEREHQRRAMLSHEAEKKVQELEEKHRRSIVKARPYFNLKTQCEQIMANQTERVESLQKRVKETKRAYAASLRALEEISNQIHERRRDYDIVVNGPREPGVGAELVNFEESLTYQAELNKVNINGSNSLTNSESDLEDRKRDFDTVSDLKQRVESLDGRSVDGMESTSSQWELELEASMKKLNEIHMSERNSNGKTVDDMDKIENQCADKEFKDNVNECVDSQLAKFSLTNYQGWQSLTQSPINSIFSKSREALRNGISKSLSNNSMKPFIFGKTKLEETKRLDEKEQSQKVLENQDSDSSDNRTSLESRNLQYDADNDNQGHLQLEEENPENVTHDINQDCRIKYSSSHGVDQTQNDVSRTQSLNSTPVKRKSLSASKSSRSLDIEKKIFDSEEQLFEKASCTPSTELPLLSIFRNSLGMSRDKSSSMIDLGDKQNLKVSLNNSNNKNLQTVSVERLANARQNLVCRDTVKLSHGQEKK